MTTPTNSVADSQEWARRLSPADVHSVLFGRSGLGRRGYDVTEVDVFLERVQVELTRLIREKGELRDEVIRLKEQVSSSDGAEGGGERRDAASLQAVRVLSAAQQTADQYVADAEQYSRRVTSDARQHAEELVEEARTRAKAILDNAERVALEASAAAQQQANGAPALPAGASVAATGEDGPGAASDTARTRQELEEQVAYLRAFGQVTRVQLRAYLEALLRDVELEWGRAQPQAVAALPALPPGLNGLGGPVSLGKDGSSAAAGTGRPGESRTEPAVDLSAQERERVEGAGLHG
ncbi:DivIVA domain-containing protein [Motilibacter aurantiacus]|uniref:DivIVA domain-containing protein n=1 Tax=Motilibacter aurantiacus TaxID=2714955 RepID=UPI00140854F0|nr:DivIVA domain-containing protein [Motilibacter aurantiacus]NHC45469.1 DivIVA domain-containing protein [Motilibacter aurantiacus]